MLEKQFQAVIRMNPAERRSKRLRHFLAALGRYRPLLVVNLAPVNPEPGSEEDPVLPLLVVTDGTLPWANVDRLSDGNIEPAVYAEDELLAELRQPGSPLAEAMSRGTVLYGSPAGCLQLLAGEPVSAALALEAVGA
jgi:hypothetical protein